MLKQLRSYLNSLCSLFLLFFFITICFELLDWCWPFVTPTSEPNINLVDAKASLIILRCNVLQHIAIVANIYLEVLHKIFLAIFAVCGTASCKCARAGMNNEGALLLGIFFQFITQNSRGATFRKFFLRHRIQGQFE